jgi:hypothetical protein
MVKLELIVKLSTVMLAVLSIMVEFVKLPIIILAFVALVRVETHMFVRVSKL